MTWEWVFLISLSMILGSAGVFWFFERQDRLAKDVEVKDLKLAIEKIVDIQNKITKDMTAISEAADETKKLLSQNHLALGFTGRRAK
jgi:hypothetical protein